MGLPLGRWLIGAFLAVMAGAVLAPTVVAAPGDLDPTFGGGGQVRTELRESSEAWALGRQSTGKLIVAGASYATGPNARFEVLRYLPDGSLDPSFGSGGIASATFPGDSFTVAHAVAIRSDDRIVVAGEANSGFGIAQFTPDGILDDIFGTNGRVVLHPSPEGAEATALALAPNGQAVVAGTAEARHNGTGPWVDAFAAVRIEPDGALDPSFGDGGSALVEMTETAPDMFSGAVFSQLADVVQYGDGRIALVGSAYDDWPDDEPIIERRFRLAVAHLDENGELDHSFSGDGKLTALVSGATHTTGTTGTLGPKETLIVGGNSLWSPGGYVARLTDDGSFDPTFGEGGSAVVNPMEPVALRIQPDGKVVAAGPLDVDRFGVARLTTEGTLDSSFGMSGLVKGPPVEGIPDEPWGGSDGHAYPHDLLLEPSSDILVAGSAMSVGEEPHIALARYQGDRLLSDRDGDGFPDEQDRCPDVPGVAPDGCSVNPTSPTPVLPVGQDFEVRAIGDSVTAGFGYYRNGSPIRHLSDAFRCRPPSPPNNRCSSPAFIAYPAVWARSIGIPTRYPSFVNYAISGASPKDWIEPSAPFRPLLDRVIAEDPDVILMTLGGNPLLTDFVFGFGQRCIRGDWTGLQTRACFQADSALNQTVPRLTRIYSRLIIRSEARVGVFLYHESHPKLIPRKKADILLSELNSAIKTAVRDAKKNHPNEAARLRLLIPPSFSRHQCNSPKPWILSADTCIHPNAAGHRAYAEGITSQLVPLIDR